MTDKTMTPATARAIMRVALFFLSPRVSFNEITSSLSPNMRNYITCTGNVAI